ncbi:semaphorin-7A-like [Thunnus thynnus]|uniref:semaphorin-7A-like n=1 Tax=Thunnus thynnus TaxID=8237 RepID=UPI0035283C3C
MMFLFLPVCLFLSSLNSLTEANSTYLPRMIFTDKESTMKRFQLPGQDTPVHILMEGDIVTVVGQTHLNSFNFQDPKKAPVKKRVLWEECNQAAQTDCIYRIYVVNEMDKANQVFVCGTNGKETLCCNMMQSEQQAECVPSKNLGEIKRSIKDFVIKKGEPSALESSEDAALYVTYSGSQENVGIHKFGKYRVRPTIHDKEQHYVGLVLSKRREDESQNKVYAFYKEKNKDTGLYSEKWLPFVTQVCMADIGGPKNNLQFSWTSQMNARLFCGDPDSRQHFSELVDVATVHADRWQDTRVYALFRNEWGMSAVCLYKIQDIDNVFTNSAFKGHRTVGHKVRPRECVTDSTKIPIDVLGIIKQTSEMEDWVQPVGKSRPLLINHHSYTHIYADSSQHKRNNSHPVLFLSLKNAVHKVTQNESQAFVIAEYRPFKHRDHILSIILRPSTSKLYVSSKSELVQLDVANCAQYGDTCEGCILARDPYCGWNGTHCSPETKDTMQDVDEGNHNKCRSPVQLPGKAFRRDKAEDSVTIPSESKYFLQCPVTSHHAQYFWQHGEKQVSCSMRDQQCLLLIDSMGPEQVGTYTCKSEEMGYSKDLAQYQLQLGSGSAGRSSSPLVWVCLMVALIKSVPCWS